MCKSHLVLVLLFLLPLPMAHALEPPVLIEDAPVGAPLQPEILTVFDGGCCFVARGGVWYTDGTQENTRRLMTVPESSIVRGRALHAQGNAVMLYDAFLALEGLLAIYHRFIVFEDLPHGSAQDLYGYEEGVVDYPYNTEYFPTLAFARLGSQLLYTGMSQELGEELNAKYSWSVDIRPGPESSSPADFYVDDLILFFSADDGVNGRELWRTDGTPDGTYLLADLAAADNSSNPTVIGDIEGNLVVVTQPTDTLQELWIVSGTSGQTLFLRNFLGTASGSLPRTGFLWGGELYFSPAPQGQAELWVTDATADGTKQVFASPGKGVLPGSVTAHEDKLLFRTLDEGETQWWQSDGTIPGTSPLALDVPTPVLSGSVMRWAIGDTLYFTSDDGQWSVSAPGAGTALLEELPQGGGKWFSNTTSVNGKLYLQESQYDPTGRLRVLSPDTWRGNVVAHEQADEDVIFENFTEVNGLLFATANEICCDNEPYYNSPMELWRSDGTQDGTFPIFSLDHEQFSPMASYRGRLVFQHNDRLMISDGTAEGTLPLLLPGTALPNSTVEAGGLLYFISDQLVVSDGTQGGTQSIELVPPENPVEYIWTAQDTLYIQSGNQVWTSDGTTVGTTPFDLPQPRSSVEYLTDWKSRHVFLFDSSEIWSVAYDGSSAYRLFQGFDQSSMTLVPGPDWFAVAPLQTVAWLKLFPNAPDSSREVEGLPDAELRFSLLNWYWHNDTFFFTNHTWSHGEELYYARADQIAPLQMLEITPGRQGSSIGFGGSVGNHFIYSAGETWTDRQLWAFDPTNDAALVYELNPYYGAEPRLFTRFADKLIFQADDFFHGYAFWGFDLGTSLLSITRDGERKTADPAVDFLVTFTDLVQGLTADDLALKSWFLKGASIESVETVSPTQFRVSVHTGLGDGTLLLMMREDHNVLTPEGERLLLPTDKDYDEGEVYDVLRLPHAADQDGDSEISLSELLRIVQFFNVGALHCEAGTEDGYATGQGDSECSPHSSDYNPQDWKINISELIRAIQVFNTGGYTLCESGEDGFCLN